VTDIHSTLVDPAPSGMMTPARYRGSLIALVIVEAWWLGICGGLAYLHWSGLPVGLFVVLGPIVTVATAIGWIRLTSDASMAVAGVAFCVAILAGVVSAVVQLFRLLSGGRPSLHGAALGWAVLTALLSLIALFAVIGILIDRQETVQLHARTAERLAEARWFGPWKQPPALLTPMLEIPGVHGYELTGGKGFRYAVVGAERVVLICLAPPDDPDELSAEAVRWQDRLRAADNSARVRGVLIVSAESVPGLRAGEMFALGVTPATTEGLLDTVGPWLGEPAHINVPIAALLMQSAI